LTRKGEYRGTRRETIVRLGKTFGVDAAVLTGRPSLNPRHRQMTLILWRQRQSKPIPLEMRPETPWLLY
jgi:hypothetical protein